MVCASPVLKGPNKGRLATGTTAGYYRHHEAGEPACRACLDAISEKNSAWAKANKEKVNAKSNRWARANRDRRRETERAYHDRNPDMRLRLQRDWTDRNRERTREYVRRRKARLESATYLDFTAEQLEARIAFWGFRCWMCGGPYEALDHVKPIAKGGAHILANLRPACKSCNSQKKDQWPFEPALSVGQ